MTIALLSFAAGLAALLVGAELLVRGATRLAVRMGISPLVIGLTVVAFGTSSPELAVSLGAAWKGQPDLVVGNAVGSNLFNVLLILGASAAITPLAVQQRLIRFDVPIMIGTCVLLWGLALDGILSRLESGLLVAGIVAYVAFAVWLSRREPQRVEAEYAAALRPRRAQGPNAWLQLALVAGGLGLCVLGARWMVGGAISIARLGGLSERVIGLTIVAGGTSLPELATSLVAAVRGQRDIAVGNVVGSNIFNILGILGLAGLLSPNPVAVPPACLRVDIPAMSLASLACLPILFTGHEIRRWEGALFLLLYAGYLTYLLTAGP